jgi:hypothetical protein
MLVLEIKVSVLSLSWDCKNIKEPGQRTYPKLLVLCRFFHDNHQFFDKNSRTWNWKFSEAFQKNWNKPN